MSNSKIKCVIVEDEEHTTMLMENYIGQMDQLEHIGSFVTPLELLNFDRIKEVQIIYLDIQMPDMTGIDFLKLKPINAEVIFTTAYSKYAVEGYELNVIDYLLKPVKLPRFIKATQKAIEQIYLKTTQKSVTSPPDEHLILKVDKKLVKVEIRDILYIQSDWNYVNVHTAQKKYMVLGSLKSMKQELERFKFIRIHKSFLINLKHFKALEGNMIELSNDIKLHVSRNYKQTLIKHLGE